MSAVILGRRSEFLGPMFISQMNMNLTASLNTGLGIIKQKYYRWQRHRRFNRFEREQQRKDKRPYDVMRALLKNALAMDQDAAVQAEIETRREDHAKKLLAKDPKRFQKRLKGPDDDQEPWVDKTPDEFTDYDNAYAKRIGEIWDMNLEHRVAIPNVPYTDFPFQQVLREVYELSAAGSPFHLKVIRILNYSQYIINVLVAESYMDEELTIIANDHVNKPNNPLRWRVLNWWFLHKMQGEAHDFTR